MTASKPFFFLVWPLIADGYDGVKVSYTPKKMPPLQDTAVEATKALKLNSAQQSTAGQKIEQCRAEQNRVGQGSTTTDHKILDYYYIPGTYY